MSQGKFINQVGDFSKYLSEKLIEGETLSKSDIQTIEDMYKANLSLKKSLNELTINIEKGYDFKNLFEGKEGDTAYLNDSSRAMEVFGYPDVCAETLIRWQAEYILDGGRTLNKPTHFEERKGSY